MPLPTIDLIALTVLAYVEHRRRIDSSLEGGSIFQNGGGVIRSTQLFIETVRPGGTLNTSNQHRLS